MTLSLAGDILTAEENGKVAMMSLAALMKYLEVWFVRSGVCGVWCVV